MSEYKNGNKALIDEAIAGVSDKELKQIYDEKYYKMNVLGQFDDMESSRVVKDFSRKNIRQLNYDENLELHITCDFNVDPMCWAVAHKDKENVYFFDEIVEECTTTALCVDIFAQKYKNHKGEIIINGDASGDNRSCTSEYTNYVIMKNRLLKHRNNTLSCLPSANAIRLLSPSFLQLFSGRYPVVIRSFPGQ